MGTLCMAVSIRGPMLSWCFPLLPDIPRETELTPDAAAVDEFDIDVLAEVELLPVWAWAKALEKKLANEEAWSNLSLAGSYAASKKPSGFVQLLQINNGQLGCFFEAGENLLLLLASLKPIGRFGHLSL